MTVIRRKYRFALRLAPNEAAMPVTVSTRPNYEVPTYDNPSHWHPIQLVFHTAPDPRLCIAGQYSRVTIEMYQADGTLMEVWKIQDAVLEAVSPGDPDQAEYLLRYKSASIEALTPNTQASNNSSIAPPPKPNEPLEDPSGSAAYLVGWLTPNAWNGLFGPI